MDKPPSWTKGLGNAYNPVIQPRKSLLSYRLAILLKQQEIEMAVERLASEIRKDYQDKNPLLLGILKGTFILAADLVRHLDFPLEIDFVTLSSYGSRTESTGKVTTVKGLSTPIRGREVLVVEDIVDTGRTLDFLLALLRKKKPLSLKVCTLLDKQSRREVPVPIDYRGFIVPDKFIVGYGLDWNEKFRYLPDIYALE
jgi:hypoxanthine phosphoribosyltransferase